MHDPTRGTVTNKQQLLAEVEDLLRTIPTRQAFTKHLEETLPWLGRAAAALEKWEFTKLARYSVVVSELQDTGLGQ